MSEEKSPQVIDVLEHNKMIYDVIAILEGKYKEHTPEERIQDAVEYLYSCCVFWPVEALRAVLLENKDREDGNELEMGKGYV